MDVADLGLAVLLQHEIAYCLDEVGFPKSDTAINEKRVISCSRPLRHLDCACPGQLIRFSGNEAIERKSRVEAAGIIPSGYFLCRLCRVVRDREDWTGIVHCWRTVFCGSL